MREERRRGNTCDKRVLQPSGQHIIEQVARLLEGCRDRYQDDQN